MFGNYSVNRNSHRSSSGSLTKKGKARKQKHGEGSPKHHRPSLSASMKHMREMGQYYLHLSLPQFSMSIKLQICNMVHVSPRLEWLEMYPYARHRQRDESIAGWWWGDLVGQMISSFREISRMNRFSKCGHLSTFVNHFEEPFRPKSSNRGKYAVY